MNEEFLHTSNKRLLALFVFIAACFALLLPQQALAADVTVVDNPRNVVQGQRPNFYIDFNDASWSVYNMDGVITCKGSALASVQAMRENGDDDWVGAWDSDYVALKKNVKSGSCDILYRNAGYMKNGRAIDIVLKLSFRDAGSDPGPNSVFTLSNAGFNAARPDDGTGHGGHLMKTTCTVNIYYHDTVSVSGGDIAGTAVPGDFWMYITDVDIFNHTAGYEEAVELLANYYEPVYIGEAISQANGHLNQQGNPTDGERLSVANTSDGVKITSTHTCSSMADSRFAVKVKNGLRLRWYGDRATTRLNFLQETPLMPDWDINQTKTPAEQNVNAKGTATFNVSFEIAATDSHNRFSYVGVTDTLDNCYDLSKATYAIYKGSQDVSDNWNFSRSGQTLTATCAKRSYADGCYGTFRLHIEVPFKEGYDFTTLPLKSGSNVYRESHNNATVTVRSKDGSETKGGPTPEVKVYTPVWKLAVKKICENTTISSGNSLYDLHGSKFYIFGDSNLVNKLGAVNGHVAGETPEYFTIYDAGTYYIQEFKAPNKGYPLVDKVVSVKLTVNDASYIADVDYSDPPLYYKTNIRKVDSDIWNMTGGLEVYGLIINGEKYIKQGNASLAGGEFELVHYPDYADHGDGASGGDMRATWRTNAEGVMNIAGSNPIAGTWRAKQNGENVIPLGTLVIRETKAPTGYVTAEPMAIEVRQDGDDIVVKAKYGDVWVYQ